MPIYSQQPWPSPRPAVQTPADLPQTVDRAVLRAVQRIRALRLPGAVAPNDRRPALVLQRAELMVWRPLIADNAWLSEESVGRIISALERADGSQGEQAAVTARIEGAVAGTLIPAFPGVTQADVNALAALPSGRQDREMRAQLKNIHKHFAGNVPAVKEAIVDRLGSYVDQPFESAARFLKFAWGSPYRDGTFTQVPMGNPSAEVSFASRQIAVGGVAGLTHLYTWQ